MGWKNLTELRDEIGTESIRITPASAVVSLIRSQGPLLLTWINFEPSIDK